jgi:hypothetical protein
MSKSISTGAQYVILGSKIYYTKLKMCRFSSGCSSSYNLLVGLQKKNLNVDI